MAGRGWGRGRRVRAGTPRAGPCHRGVVGELLREGAGEVERRGGGRQTRGGEEHEGGAARRHRHRHDHRPRGVPASDEEARASRRGVTRCLAAVDWLSSYEDLVCVVVSPTVVRFVEGFEKRRVWEVRAEGRKFRWNFLDLLGRLNRDSKNT